MENVEKRVIRISIKKMTVFIVIIVAILGIILLGFYLFNKPSYLTQNGNLRGVDSTTQLGISENSKIMYPDYYPYQNTPPVNDTREFLKTSYSAEIQTRNVKSVIRDVKNAVRDVDGRVDNSNENPKNGYVSFVIPKSNFENFKDEIESITHEKLITENISSENLLSQKQSIEQQQNTANASLATLEQQQKDLTTKHTQTKNKLQSEIESLQNQFYMMDPGPEGFSQEDLAFRKDLSNKITQKNQQIISENSNFNASNQNLKNQIENVNTQLTGIAKQDTQFINNIETVNGYISVQSISLWQLAKIFSPIHPTIVIIILIVIIWYILKRMNYLPKVELV